MDTILALVKHLYPVNGAAQRVGKNDTAYRVREVLFGEVIVGVDPDPANAEKITNWCKSYWEALHPYSAGGAYLNMIMDEGQERVQAQLWICLCPRRSDVYHRGLREGQVNVETRGCDPPEDYC